MFRYTNGRKKFKFFNLHWCLLTMRLRGSLPPRGLSFPPPCGGLFPECCASSSLSCCWWRRFLIRKIFGILLLVPLYTNPKKQRKTPPIPKEIGPKKVAFTITVNVSPFGTTSRSPRPFLPSSPKAPNKESHSSTLPSSLWQSLIRSRSQQDAISHSFF